MMSEIPASCYAWQDGPEDEDEYDPEDHEEDDGPDPDRKRDEEIERAWEDG